MDLHIKTKYDIGQDVCLVYRNKQEVNDIIPCTFCDEMDSLFIKVKNVSVQNVVDVELERKKEQLLNITFIVLSGKFLRLN